MFDGICTGGAIKALRRRLPTIMMALTILPAMACTGIAHAESCPSPHEANGSLASWCATPPYVEGSSVTRHGEFIYDDYVHDDAGANVDGFTENNPDPPEPVVGIHVEPGEPTNPEFGGAANDGDRFQWSGDFGYPSSGVGEYDDDADILEFRQAIDHRRLHLLVKLGAMSAANSTVVGVGIHVNGNPAPGAEEWPLGANLKENLGIDYFITMWGTGGEMTDYTGPTPVTTPIKVTANTEGRPPFIEADVPMPKSMGLGTWSEWAGSGLWDEETKSWALPLPSPTDTGAPGALASAPYIYNVLFRPYEPNNWWHENTQAEDLEHKDIAEDHAEVNATLLARKGSTPYPKPTGLLNVQYTTQALGSGEGVQGQPATDIFRGPVEPYSLTIPSNYYAQPHKRRFIMWFHCAFCQQNVWPFGVEHYATGGNNVTDQPLGTEHIQEIVDRNDMLVGGALQRGFQGAGEYGEFPGAGEYDLRDVIDTIKNRDRYKIDPNKIIYSGMSMGGLTTQKLMTLYPDEIAAAVSHSGAGALPERIENIRNVPFYEINGDTGLDATAPLSRQAAEEMDALGLRQMYVEWLGYAHDFGLVYRSLPLLENTAYKDVRDPDPARVTYTMEAAQEDPALGLIHNHAYWATNLVLPDGAASAKIDATALPRSSKLPKVISRVEGDFKRLSTGDALFVNWQVWNRELTTSSFPEVFPGFEALPDVKVTTTHLAAPEHAGANGFTMATSYAAETLDLKGMGIKTSKVIMGWINAKAATSLTLRANQVGAGGITLDGSVIATEAAPEGVTIDIPEGEHVVLIKP